jgi:hypothetical protein
MGKLDQSNEDVQQVNPFDTTQKTWNHEEMLKLIQDIERQKSDSNFLEGRKIEDFYDFKEAIE